MQKTIAVIGGGAAGFFAAIASAEADRTAQVTLLEKSSRTLTKVRISGGGRCNVTHACFEPHELITNYPRGSRELLGPFFSWQPADTVEWFEARGVTLKTETDGRMFPITDSSATIVNCLHEAAETLGIDVRTGCGVRSVFRSEAGAFVLSLADGGTLAADRVIVASGGGEQSGGLRIARELGHRVTELAPSLFAFNIDDPRIRGLQGLSLPSVRVACREAGEEQAGPMLITHEGLSGPVILKLSAWGARAFAHSHHHFEIRINWLADHSRSRVCDHLDSRKQTSGRKTVSSHCPFELPRRIWERLTRAAAIAGDCQWARLSHSQTAALADELTSGIYRVTGKTMNKEEFVTSGGVRLDEIDFKCMESRRMPGLHFAGEVLDIDGLTGGFNFQAAWTTGWIAGTQAGTPRRSPKHPAPDVTSSGRDAQTAPRARRRS